MMTYIVSLQCDLTLIWIALTLAPFIAKPEAMALPTPVAPPVTITCCEVSFASQGSVLTDLSLYTEKGVDSERRQVCRRFRRHGVEMKNGAVDLEDRKRGRTVLRAEYRKMKSKKR